MIGLQIVAALALLALPRAQAGFCEPQDRRRGRRAVRWIFAGTLLLYFAMPERLGRLWLLDERYAQIWRR